MNVPGRLNRHRPGDPGSRRKIAASRCPQLIPSGYRVGHEPASMQATPSRRIPAPRPGLTETLRRFTAGPGRRCKPSFILKVALLLQLKNYWGSLSPVGEGRGEGTRPHHPPAFTPGGAALTGPTCSWTLFNRPGQAQPPPGTTPSPLS